MRDSKTGPAAAETEAAESNDLQIQALLDFEPAPRMLKRKDGWTPALQRKFIARLAERGSPTLAAEALGKNRYGVEKVYKSPGAEGFREAWHQAVELFEARAAEQQERHNSAAAATRPPFADRRRTFPSPQPSPSGGEGDEEISEERKLEILESIAKKFMRKVMAEREARLSGRIVAADFYLRQITAIEIIFDLSAAKLGIDPNELLRSLRRGEHGIVEIVDTPFVQYLDAQRRAYWESDPAEPPRPKTVREEFCLDHGDHRTHVDQHGYGAMTPPARGYSEEQWAAMGYEEQVRARQAQFEEDAQDQIRWEAEAAADAAARRASGESPLPIEGEG